MSPRSISSFIAALSCSGLTQSITFSSATSNPAVERDAVQAAFLWSFVIARRPSLLRWAARCVCRAFACNAGLHSKTREIRTLCMSTLPDHCSALRFQRQPQILEEATRYPPFDLALQLSMRRPTSPFRHASLDRSSFARCVLQTLSPSPETGRQVHPYCSSFFLSKPPNITFVRTGASASRTPKRYAFLCTMREEKPQPAFPCQ